MHHRLHDLVARDLDAIDFVEALTHPSFDAEPLRERRRYLLAFLFGVDVTEPDPIFEDVPSC